MRKNKKLLLLLFIASNSFFSFLPVMAKSEISINSSQNIVTPQEHLAIIEYINQFMSDIDNKQFDKLKSYFSTDAISVAVFDGKSNTVKGPDNIVDPWNKNLTPITAIHHQVSNFKISKINAETVEVKFYGIASWYRPEKKEPVTWFVGSYNWKIKVSSSKLMILSMEYNNKFVNPSL